eukprot:CCRYP_006825-RA/>CCRYP_006825-RA protein AED:0.74 eAED:0.58 QI:0/0/0/0.5/0/0/2/0/86
MIDPATSWFKIVELLVSQLPELDIPMGTKGHRSKDAHVQSKQPYFDKLSATLIGPGLAITHVVNTLLTTTEVNSNFTSRPSVINMV